MSKFAPRLSFRQSVSLALIADGEVVVRTPSGEMTLGKLSDGLTAALRTLSTSTATEDELSELVLDMDGPNALARLYYYLDWFKSNALLCFALGTNDIPLIVVQPVADGFRFVDDDVPDDARFRLSRFSCCRGEGGNLVLESPLSMARTIISSQLGAALVWALARPRSAIELCADVEGLKIETARAFLRLLSAAGVLTAERVDGKSAEDADPALAQWEFHDLMFHWRSRPGRHDHPVGGTYPFLGQIPPLPALKPEMPGEAVPMVIPDLAEIEQREPPFARVLNRRKSVRSYGAESMTAAQLGEFLYRVARVQNIFEKNPAQLRYYESSRRPYPSGGAAYDLEVYIVVHRCTGLARGLYHYEPQDHRLRKLPCRDGWLEALLENAQGAAVLQAKPQVLIILASRFQRLSWKYRGLAYATTLKNVGVLFQTMYLIATAMELAPCALGTGNSSLFAEALGIDFFVESSVGEFVLGSLPRE